jgi:hypothetical protein
MAGIQGLNLDQQILNCVKHTFDNKDWTYWSIWRINNEIDKINKMYFYTDDNIELIDTENKLSVESFGIKWDLDTLEDTWNDFVFNLPKDSVRYALCNFEYHVNNPELPDSTSSSIRNKMVFVMWAPMSAPVKERMQITMHSLDIQKQIKQIGGIQYSIQANTIDDLHYNTIVKDIQRLSSF